MEPHQQRVVDEQSALAEKVVKLAAFISANPTFKALPEREQALLRQQLQHMDGYRDILVERIAAWQKG
jgi:hypothetical protein